MEALRIYVTVPVIRIYHNVCYVVEEVPSFLICDWSGMEIGTRTHVRISDCSVPLLGCWC